MSSTAPALRLLRSALILGAVIAVLWFVAWLLLVALYRVEEYEFSFSIRLPGSDEPRALQFSTADAEHLGLDDTVIEIPPSTADNEHIWVSTSLTYSEADRPSYCFVDEIVLRAGGTSEVIATPGLCVDTKIDRVLRQPIQIELRVEAREIDAIRISPADAAALGATEHLIPIESAPSGQSAKIPTTLEYDLGQHYLEYCFRDPVIGLIGTEEDIVVYSRTCMRSIDGHASPLRFVSGSEASRGSADGGAAPHGITPTDPSEPRRPAALDRGGVWDAHATLATDAPETGPPICWTERFRLATEAGPIGGLGYGTLYVPDGATVSFSIGGGEILPTTHRGSGRGRYVYHARLFTLTTGTKLFDNRAHGAPGVVVSGQGPYEWQPFGTRTISGSWTNNTGDDRIFLVETQAEGRDGGGGTRWNLDISVSGPTEPVNHPACTGQG